VERTAFLDAMFKEKHSQPSYLRVSFCFLWG